MDFQERLKKYLQEDTNTAFTKAEPVDPDTINKKPDERVEPEKSLKVPDDVKTLKQFFVLTNPVRGEVRRDALYRYIRDFRQRGRDVIILKGKSSDKTMPFFAVNRAELSAYLASIMDDDAAMKDFSSQIETIYTTEECELLPVDYIDFVIKQKISIMTNPAVEQFGVDTQSKEIPTNLKPKNQVELSVEPQKIEDSSGLDKSQKEEK